jgi:uncharacterized repeat protein (TIGR01451 family)
MSFRSHGSRWSGVLVALTIAAVLCGAAGPASAGQAYLGEVEPNGTSATASPLAGTNFVVRADLFPNGDTDFFSFTATAGDRVYAATMTSFSAGNSTDSQVTLLASDGTTVIEFDDDNGFFAGLSSSIAGATIPTTGTYFLKVNDFTAGTTSERPYELHVRVQSGAPTPEVEGNDTPATANVLPANGWVSGTRNPAAAAEQDWFSLTLNAGDTVYLALDLNPERDGVVWNGRLGFALFGDATNQILVVDDAGTGDVTPVPNNPSEALTFTVKTAGTYFAFVDSASAAVGGPTATYHLSVSVHPATNEGVNCTTYTSTDVPKTIGPGTGLVSSVITVPGNPRIADVDVDIVLNHTLMADVDAHLRSPAGNDNGLFTDIGSGSTGLQAQMDLVFDDEAGLIPAFTALRNVQVKPENTSTGGTASTSGAYRLSWFDGENAGGTWTLDLRDDLNTNGGTLTAWSLRICEAPAAPACAPGFVPTTVFSTDFEAGAAGFTHTGTADEWELGLPATVATTTANPVAGFSTCNSGVSCWKTDLDNTYNASSNQDLLSPNINLAGLSAPVVVTWAQRHQVETANFDHMFVDFQQAGGATPVRLYEWLEPTPISASAGTGNPQANIGGSAGWGVFSRRADSLAGLNSEMRFHLDSDTTVQFGGLAIDDVSVTACRLASADLSITKSDGVTTAVPGGSVTYTITASNAGTDPVTGATVIDNFSAAHASCTWTCVGAGGGTCTAAGSGNINDATVNLPVGGSVTYTATCGVTFGATGSLVNTATVSSSVTDPNPGNNSATDTDTLTPMADLGITKTDGVTTAVPGGAVTYTIVATNAGPSNAVSSTVVDTFPAVLTCTWTCTGAGGTCTAAGSGNINDSVSLPAGASITYTASCTISAAATGTLSNTATVSSATPDPTPGNNSATDSDTLTPQADLSVTKTDGVTSATAGGSVTYTIVASNAGPSNAPGTAVADTFPAACTTVSYTSVAAGGATGNTAAGSGNIADTLNLPVGSSVTYTATCTISAAATGTLSNTATVATGAGITDPNLGNNSATDSDALGAQADLSITKTDGVTSATAGGSVTYTIAVSNAGPSTATGAGVADTFPAFCTGVTYTSVAAGGATGNTAAGSGNIADSLNLPSGGSVTYTAICTISGAASGILTNTATVTAPGSVTDPNPANNSATDSDMVAAPAGAVVSGTKTVAGTFEVGGTITYTVILSNTGTGAQGDNPGNEFIDVLPPTLALVSASATSPTAVATTGTNTVTWNGTIPAGGSVTITITATILPSAAGQTIANQGTISFDSDGNGTNESTAQTDDPGAAGGANPTTFVVGGGPAPAEIPTLSPLGLAGLALLLAALALVLLRRRSQGAR